MKNLIIALFMIIVSIAAKAGSHEVKHKDLPELKLALTETLQLEDYSKKIGAFQNTDGFMAKMWCKKLSKPKQVGAYSTSLDCKLIDLE